MDKTITILVAKSLNEYTVDLYLSEYNIVIPIYEVNDEILRINKLREIIVCL